MALTLTDTVMVIFFTVAGFVGLPDFFRFLTFYPFADKKSIVSSYFIVQKRVFCGDI